MVDVKTFFDYHSWATEKLLNYVKESTPELFTKKIDSVFSSIQETFEHIYTVDRLWFSRIQQNTRALKDVSFSNIDQARAEFRALHHAVHSYLETANLSDSIIYSNSTGKMFENPMEDIFIHIVNHGTYHRGNVTAMIRSLGQKSISTDYIFYVREKESNASI